MSFEKSEHNGIKVTDEDGDNVIFTREGDGLIVSAKTVDEEQAVAVLLTPTDLDALLDLIGENDLEAALIRLQEARATTPPTGEPVVGVYDDEAPHDGDAAECKHCGRELLFEGGWIDPEATGDDSVWRETCDENHEDRIAAHEPKEA